MSIVNSYTAVLKHTYKMWRPYPASYAVWMGALKPRTPTNSSTARAEASKPAMYTLLRYVTDVITKSTKVRI